MILDIVSASASWADNEFHVSFGVVPEDDARLVLKTGEIFQNLRYASLRNQKNETIPTTLFVGRQAQSAAGANLPSEMRYFPGIGEEGPEIRMVWRLPADHLANFHSLLLARQVPRQAFIFFASGKLQSWREPDGSGQIWDNEESPSVRLENVSFQFDLRTLWKNDTVTTEASEGDELRFFSNTASVNPSLMRKLSSIESLLVRICWVAGLIVLIMLVQTLTRHWH